MNKKKTKQPRPTVAELEHLRVLWERGPSTVREIHESIAGGTGYTTTLKILQKMAEKGLLVRDESQRSHVYDAAIDAEFTQRNLVVDLLKSAFGGKPGKLVIQALSEQRASEQELAEIRSLLDKMEQDLKTKRKQKGKRK